MTDAMKVSTALIAAKVRGAAAESRFTQRQVAETLDLSRTSVSDRYAARIPFTAPELLTLAAAMNVPISRFFPEVEEVSAR